MRWLWSQRQGVGMHLLQHTAQSGSEHSREAERQQACLVGPTCCTSGVSDALSANPCFMQAGLKGHLVSLI